MNFNLRDVKYAESRNGYAMYAKFFINDIFVAHFIDKGDGSQPDFKFTIHPQAKPLFNELKSRLETLPEVFIEEVGMELKIDEYLFIDLLHAAIINKQEFKLLAA